MGDSLHVGGAIRASRRNEVGRKQQMHSPVMAIAALLVFIGLFAFFAVLLRQV
jgi:hypothetical protein